MTVDIALKRAYAPAQPDIDGYRILVDRLWPRGVSKEKAAIDAWNKDIAPSPQLRTWWGHNVDTYVEFAEKYRAELDENPAVGQLIELMKEHSDGRITLVYGAKDGVFNHAHVLRNYLIAQTSEKIEPVVNSQGFEISTIPAKKTTRKTSMPPKAADLSGLVFRKLTTDDATALQWVEAVTFEDTFLLTSEPQDNDGFIAEAFRLETIEEELSTEKMLHFGLIDEHSGEMAAFLKVNLYGVQTEDGPEIPRNSLEVQRLYVMPRFKRRGLGTYLMEKAVDIAQEHGCTSLWLGVWQYNFAAQQFYKSWGYERFSEHTFMVGEDPQVDFLLQKKL